MQVIKPDNEAHWLELRKTVLTSTDVPALFNLSPYQTYSELWYRKAGLYDVAFEETSRIRWGKILEPAIAHGIAEEQGWIISPMRNFIIDKERRLGSSYDYFVDPDAVLEIKNVDALQYRERWDLNDDGDLEAPPHIEIQLQHEMMLANRSKGYIGALVGGNDVKLLERDPDSIIQNAIVSKSAEFWDSIDAGRPPAPNYEQDADLIIRLHGFAEPRKVLFFENNEEFRTLAMDHKMVCDQIKQLEIRKDALKAHMLTMIGDAESIKCAGFSVTAGMVGPAQVSYERAGYRNFRINWPRQKK